MWGEPMANDLNTEASSAVAPPRVRDDRDRLIHDLEVHQAELEAQNQQLREAQQQLE